jgi:hypothetical protein
MEMFGSGAQIITKRGCLGVLIHVFRIRMSVQFTKVVAGIQTNSFVSQLAEATQHQHIVVVDLAFE